jgi:hypothetical protein
MSCPCTIHDVRREQIEEPSGRLWIQVVCNNCNTVLDVLSHSDVRERERVEAHLQRVGVKPPRERAGGEF